MGEKKKWNYGLADEFFKNKGFFLLNKKDDNEKFLTKQKVSFCDKDGYYYFCSQNKLLNGNIRKFDISNPYTIQNIKLWLILNDKPFELISDRYEGNGNLLKWKCLCDECGEIFNSSWNSIQQGRGCGFCHGLQVGLSNCLATKNLELTSEWHPTKNGNLTPYNVTANSSKYIWWQCSKNPKHIWETTVSNRNGLKSGCPYCAGDLPSDEYNLLVCNPELSNEWNYEKNNKRPEDYTPNSNQYIWWICKDCKHEWGAKINDRNGKYKEGCPQCKNSKGEKSVSIFLKKFNLNFVIQKQFHNLIGLGGGNLSYDFYLPKHNLLIEYQGRQHEQFIDGLHQSQKDFEKQLEHDNLKRKYANKHNIKLLEIWYKDFDRIEEILSEVLEYKINKF